MLSHTNILATTKSSIERRQRAGVSADPNNRHCSFLPMAHLYERLVLISNFLHGTQVAFCPVPEKLFEYYPLVKPTNLCMVPRVLNKVYDAIMAEVGKSKIKRFLISQALHNEKPTLFSRFIFRKVRNLFGGEVFIMLTGSAPITPEVLHFFRIALEIPIVEGYGQTESTAAGTGTHLSDLSCGTVGSPLPSVEIKLIDVSGTNYRSNNNQGEVCIRGSPIFKGNLHI
jgi:long-chain acyl-CoA synthetase